VDRPITTSPRMLAIFFVALVIPGSLAIGSLTVNPSRIVLLIVFVPLFLRWFSGKAGRITPADVGVLSYCLWVALSLFVLFGLRRIPSAGIQFVEMFGGYLIGRTLVRNSEDYRTFIRYFFYTLVFLSPFALTEFITGSSPIRSFANALLTVDEMNTNLQPRLGFLNRAQGPFAHALLLGLFCSMGLANLYYVYDDWFVKRLSRVALALAMIFMTLSSAPLISSGLQLMMIIWDCFFAFLRARWLILILLGLTILVILQVALPDGLLTFIFDHVLLMPQTGYARIEQLHWGTLSVMNHPFFGAEDWVRPYYLGFGSIDNFWLATAIRYGLPSLLLLWFAIAMNVLGILTATGLDPVAQRYRHGYIIPLTGLLMVLATVAIWGPVSTFVLTYFGAGAWFYVRPQEIVPALGRRPVLADPPPGVTPMEHPATVRRPAPGRSTRPQVKPGSSRRPPE
jgi:hypothetical protein